MDDTTFLPTTATSPVTPAPSSASALLRGRLMVVAAAVLWSTSGFFVKSPIFDDWPKDSKGIILGFWRAVFALLLIAPMVRRIAWKKRMIPMAGCFLCMNMAYLSAMVFTTAGNAIWLQCTAPVWVFFVGVFLFKERIHPYDWILVGCCAAGIGLIVSCESQAAGTSQLGVMLAVLSSFFYAGVVLSLRSLRSENAAWLVALNHAVTVVALFPLVLWLNVWPSGSQWFYLAGFGILQMGLPYLLFSLALRQMPGHEAASIALLEPLLVPIWVMLIWGNETPAWWTIAGGGLILLGLAVRYFAGNQSTPNAGLPPG